ncbi:AAA family ATPase [Paenarthrobacter nicotinovorans]|uniref:AAA family ATPase n=1 Tax=Paenarthrobacter nicotinovorans TaxID=29320 RepID=UPI00119CB4FF|nr:SMC family ATPase [Paenarthrobacter nicotinovorans]
MRIHRLDIEAFGPFATPQHIDFDLLSAQGLFLLNGATGAGKTSILDAICFALYGSVPGARQDGKRLRSDHALPGAEPRVVCEFSARGRRFEVTRSPAWDRPSARGRKGFTTQQAKTLLREKVAGHWEEKSSRNDEVGAELSDVLGMDRDQFTRVVMLPQGDFAAFLRSKAGDRLDLLQKLFGTQRFEAIEQELARQAADAAKAVEENASELKMLLDKAASERDQLGLEQAGVDGEDTPASAAPDPGLWLAEVQAQVDDEVKRRQDEAAVAESLWTRLSGELREEQEKTQRHERLRSATQRKVLLELAAPRALENKELLGKHRRAAVLNGQLDAVDAAERKFTSAETRMQQLREKLSASGLDSENPAAALESVKASMAVIEARLPDEQRLEEVALRLDAERKEVARQRAAAGSVAAALTQLREEAAQLENRMEPLVSVAADVAAAEREATAAAELVGVVSRHTVAAAELEALTERHLQARAAAQDFKEQWLDVREQRLANAAGELAAALESGEPCAVCGSTEHPNLASAVRTALSLAQEEEEAKALFEASEETLGKLGEKLSAAAQMVAGLQAQGGATEPAEADDRLSKAEAAATAAQRAATLLEELKARQDHITERLLTAQQEQAECLQAEGQASSTVLLLQEQHEVLEAGLSTLRSGYPTLRARLDAVAADCALLQEATDAGSELSRASEARLDALESLKKALLAAGFSSANEARHDILPAADVVGLEKDISDFDAETARLDELFANEDIVLAAKEMSIGELPLPEPELAEAQRRASVAAGDAQAAALAAGLAAKSAETIRRLRTTFEALAEAGNEPRKRALMLAGLADTARGSGDNGYRMSLNTYVLAARLEQVALAASERLVSMSDGRYTLQHTDAKAARGAKSGLGLEVVDEWTGQRRDTSTLSGGESFMASLALALGLADVVQQEAGGVDIETLFVDEGFGSLDEQALEQVMDALEGLRDGGRVVGLVSHVAEMKQRITSQLQVVKGRNGSSIRFAEAVPV